MSNKLLEVPSIITVIKYGGSEDEGNIGGKGSADSTVDVDRPCSWDDWNNIFADNEDIFDFNHDGSAGDWEDYEAWIRSLGLTDEEIDHWLGL